MESGAASRGSQLCSHEGVVVDDSDPPAGMSYKNFIENNKNLQSKRDSTGSVAKCQRLVHKMPFILLVLHQLYAHLF